MPIFLCQNYWGEHYYQYISPTKEIRSRRYYFEDNDKYTQLRAQRIVELFASRRCSMTVYILPHKLSSLPPNKKMIQLRVNKLTKLARVYKEMGNRCKKKLSTEPVTPAVPAVTPEEQQLTTELNPEINFDEWVY